MEFCHRCGRTEPDPVMGTVDAIAHCQLCDQPVCSACADHDYDPEWGSQVVCKGECSEEQRMAEAEHLGDVERGR